MKVRHVGGVMMDFEHLKKKPHRGLYESYSFIRLGLRVSQSCMLAGARTITEGQDRLRKGSLEALPRLHTPWVKLWGARVTIELRLREKGFRIDRFIYYLPK